MVAHYYSEGLDLSLFTIVLVFVKWQILIWDETLWQLMFEALTTKHLWAGMTTSLDRRENINMQLAGWCSYRFW